MFGVALLLIAGVGQGGDRKYRRHNYCSDEKMY